MKKIKGKIIGFLVVLICIGFAAFKFQNINKNEIEKWDNIYNENNIAFYYSDSNDEKIKVLNNMYNIKKSIPNEDKDIDKAIKIATLLSDIMTFDDVPNSKNINGYDIIKEKNQGKKASSRDLAIIYRDFLQSYGFKARAGEFKNKRDIFNKEKSYYVVEYWSKNDNKWVMIDFIDRGYFDNKGFLCSAMEILENDIRNYNYTGITDRKEYIPKFKKYLNTYTIDIDNTTDMKKSNSCVTYVKNEKDVFFKFKGSYIRPTIFTQNKDTINRSPIDKDVKSDEKGYIILMKKQEIDDPTADDSKASFIVGGFKDGKIMDKYYIKTDTEVYEEVKQYKDIILKKGENNIEISLDGVNSCSVIKIKF